MPDPIATTCATCRFSVPDPRGNLKQRVCRRGPPSNVALPNQQGFLIQAFWPVVSLEDFCFAHEPKPVPILGLAKT